MSEPWQIWSPMYVFFRPRQPYDLWHKGAYYQWLCAHGAGPDGEGIGTSSDAIDAWAKGKLPE